MLVMLGDKSQTNPEELECHGCCLEQLRTVKIGIGSRFKHDSSLLRFILVLLSISRHLLRMKRTSQKVQVEFNTKFIIVSVLI
jgi:hypothetical protein